MAKLSKTEITALAEEILSKARKEIEKQNDKIYSSSKYKKELKKLESEFKIQEAKSYLESLFPSGDNPFSLNINYSYHNDYKNKKDELLESLGGRINIITDYQISKMLERKIILSQALNKPLEKLMEELVQELIK